VICFKSRNSQTIELQYFHRAPLAPSSTPCFRGPGCPYFAARCCLFSHFAGQTSHHEFAEHASTEGLGAFSTTCTTEQCSAVSEGLSLVPVAEPPSVADTGPSSGENNWLPPQTSRGPDRVGLMGLKPQMSSRARGARPQDYKSIDTA
jgi:hypothetical protein